MDLPIELDKVEQFEKALLTLPQVQIPTEHLVHGGMYARTVFVPAGTYSVGATLNCDTISIVMGTVELVTDNGTVIIEGFNVIPANAGIKRAGRFLTDTYWCTVMAVPESVTTPAAAEEFMTDDFNRLINGLKRLEST